MQLLKKVRLKALRQKAERSLNELPEVAPAKNGPEYGLPIATTDIALLKETQLYLERHSEMLERVTKHIASLENAVVQLKYLSQQLPDFPKSGLIGVQGKNKAFRKEVYLESLAKLGKMMRIKTVAVGQIVGSLRESFATTLKKGNQKIAIIGSNAVSHILCRFRIWADTIAEKYTKRGKTKTPAKLGALVAGVVGLWLAFGAGIYLVPSDWAQRSQFGDMFVPVNTLFSALAFTVLIYAIWLQREELGLQREELEQMRKELKRGGDAQEASQKTLEQQIELLTLSTQTPVWLKAQEVWTNGHFRDARSRVFMRLLCRNEDLTKQDAENAKDVCRRLEEFAQLVSFLDRQKVLDVWDDPLAKAWVALEHTVREERNSSGWQTKWNGFEQLGKDAVAKLVRENRDPRHMRQSG